MGLNQIQYPPLGQTSNWGGTINRNFKILVDEIEKVNNQAEATKNLVGAGVPYIRQDNNQFFVKIVRVDENDNEVEDTETFYCYRLDYYNKDDFIGAKGVISNELDKISYYEKQISNHNLFSAIPNFLGAYVVNSSITLDRSAFKGTS